MANTPLQEANLSGSELSFRSSPLWLRPLSTGCFVAASLCLTQKAVDCCTGIQIFAEGLVFDLKFIICKALQEKRAKTKPADTVS
jgi:hypothetical protein